MANKPTFKQTARIWSHCAAYGSGNIDWAKLGREGGLSKHVASDIIGAITAWEKECIPLTKDSVEELIGGFIDGYTIIKAFNGESKDEAKDAPKDKKKTKAVPTSDDETLDKLLDGLGMFLNKDTLSKLRDAIDQRLTGTTDGYQAVIDELTAKLDELGKRPPLPTLEPLTDGYIKHEMFDRAACYVKAGLNTMLIGPSGSGKSMMPRVIAETLGLDFYEESVADKRYTDIIGSTQVTDGTSSFQFSNLVKALQKENMIVCINEIFGLEPDVLLALNDGLEMNTRRLQTKGGPVDIKATVVATTNTTGRSVSRQYTGAKRADDSTISRFAAKLNIGFDERVENKLLEQIKEKDARKSIKDNLTKLRKELKAANISHDCGTRELQSAITNYAACGDAWIAFEDAFLGGLSKPERTKIGM
jgi:MoxR-like ATPase